MSMAYSSWPRVKVRNSWVGSLLRLLSLALCMLWHSLSGETGQGIDIQNQGHAAIAHDGGAGDALDTAEILLEALDHHLLLADQFIHLQGEGLALGLEYQHDAADRRRWRHGEVEQAVQREQRQVFATHADHRAAVAAQAVDVFGLQLQGLDYVGQGHHVTHLVDLDYHAVEYRQGQGQANGDMGALAGHRVDVDTPADRGDIAAHHVHADPAPGQVGHLFGGGEEVTDLRSEEHTSELQS